MNNSNKRKTYAGRKSSRRVNDEKAPILLRVTVWFIVVALCVGVGYYGIDFGFRLLTQKGILPKPEGMVSSSRDAQNLLASSSNGQMTDIGKRITINVYTPLKQSDTLKRTELKMISGNAMEDEISLSLKEFFKLSDEELGLDSSEPVVVRHVFRNGQTAYLDLSLPFSNKLKQMGDGKDSLYITGILTTIVENFKPIERVFFLIDGNQVDKIGNLSFSRSWELTSK